MNSISPQHASTRGFQAHLTPSQWRELIAAGSTATFPGHARLLDQGDRRPLVYAIEQGRVRVVYTEPDGHEVLVAIRGPGDLIGEYAQRDRGDHMASVWALENCVATVLHSDPFDRFLRKHRLDDVLQRYMLSKARQGAQRLWRIANLHAEQRLAQLFLEVVSADAARGNQFVPMSQQLIANSLGITRRSINERLSQWRKRGLVRTRPGLIEILDLPALARLASLR
ncbi:Crp/Fnr family transcriptional regulator [Glycomyces paridis]|uniref:Crp/Fnr family transcriptional regulator n=1 Tax=Glycomyces paridis TaxID=2126555 RepID=A0A4S8PHD6_9ACTN|nr:Crp/Fnr family transcriptional regulator [Glycomyces paridis]THV28752.1 Crp/Fnr family transcriptional regulator [Glycomyces paridis]